MSVTLALLPADSGALLPQCSASGFGSAVPAPFVMAPDYPAQPVDHRWKSAETAANDDLKCTPDYYPGLFRPPRVFHGGRPQGIWVEITH